MGLFGHGGLLSKVYDKTIRKANNFVKNDLGGWDNLLQGAGLVAAGIFTGGAATALGAGTIAGMSAATAGGIVGGLAATGSVGRGIEARKLELEAESQNAAAQAEIDKANRRAENERRAQLYSLRKQVGRPVGAKVGIYNNSSGSGTTSLSQYNGVVLG